MKKTTMEKVRNYILDFTTIDELKNYIENGRTGRDLVSDGFFACYYDQAYEALKEFYGEEFDGSRYFNKDGSTKYRNGECYVWTIYKNVLAMVIDKMTKA